MCLSMLRERLSRDYSGYRKAMLRRRIARRQRLRGVERLADYVTIVDAEPEELRGAERRSDDPLYRASESAFERARLAYGRTLDWALRHSLPVLVLLGARLRPTSPYSVPIPKDFFPQQDTGRLIGEIVGDKASRSRR